MTDTGAFEAIAATRGAPMIIVTARAGARTRRLPRRVLDAVQHRSDALSRVSLQGQPHVRDRAARHRCSWCTHCTMRRRIAHWRASSGRSQVETSTSSAGVGGWTDLTIFPVLLDCDWFAGSIVDRVDLGDHVGFVLDVTSGDAHACRGTVARLRAGPRSRSREPSMTARHPADPIGIDVLQD